MPLDDAALAWLALALVPELLPRRAFALVERFGTPHAVLDAPAGALAAADVPPAVFASLGTAAGRARTETLKLARAGATLVAWSDDAYPPALRHIAQPPLVLAVRGSLGGPDEPAIAIVGARRASGYGRHMAAEPAPQPAQAGAPGVSGLPAGAGAPAPHAAPPAGVRRAGAGGCAGAPRAEPPDPAGGEARAERKGRHRGALAGAAAAARRAAGRRRGGRAQRARAADPRRDRSGGAARRRRDPPGRGTAGRGARDAPGARAARSRLPAPRQALLPARRVKHMAKNLVIVESPAKAKTLGKYLGRNYQVKASIGHVMDLPKSKLGVDVERDFAPEYHVIQGKTKVLEEIKKAAQDKENGYLAPDPDREGEAIAWHIAQKLGRRRRNPHRVLFNEITHAPLLEALHEHGNLDHHRSD